MSTPTPTVRDVLAVLADAAEVETDVQRRRHSRRPDRFLWLSPDRLPLLLEPGPQGGPARPTRRELEPFEAIDAIRPGEDTIRIGCLWVVGTMQDDEGDIRIFEPLVTTSVTVSGGRIVSSGDVRLHPAVTDRAAQVVLEGRVEATLAAAGEGYVQIAVALARAAAFTAESYDIAERGPITPTDVVGLRIYRDPAVFAQSSGPDFSATGSLRTWSTVVGDTTTALHALYLDDRTRADGGFDLASPYRLSAGQHDALMAARTEPVTVIAGAPGTGKTHTVAALVGDAVAHGRSVLVAAKSAATVQAITELLRSRPGPDPVVFGSTTARRSLSSRLAEGGPASVPASQVDAQHQAMVHALTDRNERWAAAARQLRGLAILEDRGVRRRLQDRLPGLSRADVSLFEVEQLVETCGLTPPPWYRLGQRRRWSRLLSLLGVREPPDAADLDQALALAAAVRGLHEDPDDLDVGIDLRGLAAAQQRLEDTTGVWMDGLARDERLLTSTARGIRGALATALRAGRAARRAQLAELGARVTQTLPIWVGTLGDIDDLLPMAPASFDLVVLDEASSIDQPRAATALLRGRRAVIVGDPKQLRHVSFVADDRIAAALAAHLPHTDIGLRAKLDVRRNSIFDVAAATAPIRVLDEHFRSVPHLFDFVGRRLYDDEVRVATVTPRNDRHLAITVVRGSAERNEAKVVEAEVDQVMTRLAELRRDGCTSVGVISPFRAQSDAIERRALQVFRHTTRSLGLRVGTVHEFQGMERDVVLVSLGIGSADGAGVWRFADDPHLFAVMATRARQQIEWLISATPPPDSLIGEYLSAATTMPLPQHGVTTPDEWTATLLDRVGETGHRVLAPYDVGHHRIDLVVGDAPGYVGVHTSVAGDAHEHLRRHLDLRRNGWDLQVALPHTWADRPGELALRLAALCGTAAQRS